MFELYHYTQKEIDEILKSITILVDTREHEGCNNHILNYLDAKKVPWKKSKLNYGDYSFYIPKNEELNIYRDLYFDKQIMVERKNSLDELASNISKERERIKKELALAPENKIMIIENANYFDLINGNYRSEYSPKSFNGTIFSFWHEFNFPIIFMPDPKYTGAFIRWYFQYYLRNIIK